MIRSLIFLGVVSPLALFALAQPFVGILLWSWISFLNPHREIYGFATGQPWAMAVFAATVVGCFVAGEPRRFPLNAVTGLFLVFLLLITITTVFGLGDWNWAWQKWDRTAKTIAGLLLTAALLTSKHRLHALIWLMVISLGYYGVKAGIFTLMTGGSYRVWGPPLTMISDNNHVGAAMLVSLPLMNYLRMRAAHRIVRVGLAVAMVLTLFAIVGTHSRGALVGLLAVSVMMWLRSRYKLVGGTVFVLCVAGAVAFMPPQWSARMHTTYDYQEDASATTRLALWEASWRLAMDRPLVGAGFRGPYNREAVDRVMPGGPARAVHSIWFEVIGEHGFPTFLVWLGFTLSGAYYAWRLTRLARAHPSLAWAADLGRMVQVSIVAYCSAGTFLSLAYWDYYWTLLVVTAAAHAFALRERAALTAAPDGSWAARSARRPAPAWAGARA